MQGAYGPLKHPGAFKPPVPSRRRASRRVVVLALLALGAISLSALYTLSPFVHIDVSDNDTVQVGYENLSPASEHVAQCPAPTPLTATPPAPANLWAPLSADETAAIAQWLAHPTRALNLTPVDRAAPSDNMIFLIESRRPAKAAALAYLGAPGPGTLPERWARAVLHLGAAAVPVVRVVLVGPLPVGPRTALVERAEHELGDVPYNARGFPIVGELAPLLRDCMLGLADITEDLFGGSARGLENDTLIAGMSGPFSFDGAWRRTWVTWRHAAPGAWLHPLGFYQYVDFSGTDPEQWRVLKVVYDGQVFPTIAAFRDAWHAGLLRRRPRLEEADAEWSTRRRPQTAPPRDLDELPGPRQVSFGGLRFRVDRAAQYVSWMGWGMYLGFDRDMGLSLWDVRFLGERIVYELAPQDALAQYAGNDPMQVTTAWLDRFFGMGSAVRDMLPGYDCPHEAVFLPATTHIGGGSITHERAICVFEHDTGRPISRHTGWQDGEFGAVRGYVLTVRSISTFDYMFHLDGTIEVRVSASGYLQAGFWEPTQSPYGTPIHGTTMGSLHDHVINFKIDLDVVGTENSLLHTHTDQEEVQKDWFDDDWGQTVIQQRITREYIENEDAARLTYPTNMQGGYAIVNRNETNRWGTPRGYAIHPGYNPVHNTVVGSRRLLNNADWARYNFAVSRRKESERSSSSMWNMNLPGAPPVNFSRFFDGEDIAQEDLVAWVNLGMHHLPQAEDAPNTRTNTAASSIFLTPLNYFDSDVSLAARNAVLLRPGANPGDTTWTTEEYGVQQPRCVPPPVPPLVYDGARVSMVGDNGRPVPVPPGGEAMWWAGEGAHRLRLDL
ncbi:copper amine oxidase [Gloeopeniophorella convolvens]|nr:copper amine oxidase [Gloeopeniophorella convolvens]